MDNFIINTGKILRAIRKYYGINQSEFAKLIDVNQSTLSRIELGALEMSAFQWLNLVEEFNLNPRCIITGKIEEFQNIKFNINEYSKVKNKFKIHSNYQRLMGLKVRAIYPLLVYLEDQLGYEETSNIINSLDIDSDYFVIQNNLINSLFFEKLYYKLKELSLIDENNVKNVFERIEVQNTYSHFLKKNIKKKTSHKLAFKRLAGYLNEHVDSDTQYEFNNFDYDVLYARNQSHLSYLELTDEFLKFKSLYMFHYINSLKEHIGANFDIEIQYGENYNWRIVNISNYNKSVA